MVPAGTGRIYKWEFYSDSENCIGSGVRVRSHRRFAKCAGESWKSTPKAVRVIARSVKIRSSDARTVR